MDKKIRKYLLLFFVLMLFWITGAMVDSLLWFHDSYQTPIWIVENINIFWLVLNQFLLPLAILLIIMPEFNTLIFFLGSVFIGSVVWDLVYSLLTRGILISDSMEKWFEIGGFSIGVSKKYALLFYLIRLLIGFGFFWLLLYRLKKVE
ncbi:MAG: hypothetical protein Q7S33_01145 [Nanoarchaeota archaeon]|nr:hypothetical protein [Nanoarchaeota archaeon]